MSLHMITHAVMFAVIATLVKKYLHLFYQMEALQDDCQYCEWKHISDYDFQTELDDKNVENRQNFSSFVSCQSSLDPNRKVCHFKKLCYEPTEDEFIYFYSDDDQELLNKYKNDLPYLSTPIDFNGHKMSIIYLPGNTISQFNIRWFDKTTYIFSRFKSDNLMHVLHDDLIPLYTTLRHFENMKSRVDTKFDAQLLFIDNWLPGDYKMLYHLFTKSTPLYKEDLQKGSELICFSSAIIGLLLDSLWYSYGFIKPQGPIIGSSMNVQYIKSTSQFILQHLNIEKELESEYIVLISRKENRKILNENELVEKMSQDHAMKVVLVGSETHSPTAMISLVSHSRGIIGMHGSLMSLAIFLKPGSFLIELFPYAVPAIQYTPYKTLANLEGMSIIYKSWEDMDKNSAIGHKDYPPELGGIKHLSMEKQEEILQQTKVPKHLCCDDPSWLHHIYQDTFVKTDEISDLIKLSIKESKNTKIVKFVATPSGVKNLKCIFEKGEKCRLDIVWERPWNVKFLNSTKLHYEIIVESPDIEDPILYIVERTSFTVEVVCDKDYVVWMRTGIDDVSYSEYRSQECIS